MSSNRWQDAADGASAVCHTFKLSYLTGEADTQNRRAEKPVPDKTGAIFNSKSGDAE